MEDYTKLIEPLIEKATEYSKTVYELVKLKIIDKSLDVVSSLITHYVVLILALLFVVFSSVGLSFWLGEILGKIYYGFFVSGAFYFTIAIVLHFFLRKPFKRLISNFIIKHELN
jgi:hypothetical protein